MENIFFDKRDLKYCGNNVIIGKTVRIRRPQDVIIGDNVIIDDFAYIACGMEIGPYVHISSNCSFIGGPGFIKIGALSGIATGCRLITASTDYFSGSFAMPTIPEKYATPSICSPITIEEFVAVGANCVIMPGVVLKQGISIAAQSVVTKKTYRKWMLYGGNPAKKIIERDMADTLETGKRILEENHIDYQWMGE